MKLFNNLFVLAALISIPAGAMEGNGELPLDEMAGYIDARDVSVKNFSRLLNAWNTVENQAPSSTNNILPTDASNETPDVALAPACDVDKEVSRALASISDSAAQQLEYVKANVKTPKQVNDYLRQCGRDGKSVSRQVNDYLDSVRNNNEGFLNQALAYGADHKAVVAAAAVTAAWMGYEIKNQWNALSLRERQRNFIVKASIATGRGIKKMAKRPQEAILATYVYFKNKIK